VYAEVYQKKKKICKIYNQVINLKDSFPKNKLFLGHFRKERMNTNKTINPNSAKFVSTFIIGFLSILLVVSISSTTTRKALITAEENYISSCKQLLEGYSKSVQWYMENYHTSLDSIFYEELLATKSGDEIQNWIISNKDFVHKDFKMIYFIDEDNSAYFSDGNIIKGTDFTFSKNSDSYYVSDIFTMTSFENPVIALEEPVFYKDGRRRGTLCAVIDIYTFQQLTDKIQINTNANIYLLDRKGKFIINDNTDYIGKSFTPPGQEYKKLTTQSVASQKKGYIETQDANGQLVDLYFTGLPFGWTMTLGLYQKDIQQAYKSQTKGTIYSIIITSIILFALIFLENYIIDNFYKKQMIEAEYDPLTKMWTRQRFEKEATKLLRHGNTKYMLIESDIRGFKFINQNYGEKVADGMIFFYSKLLNNFTHEFNGIIGRGYADHFYSLIKVTEVRKAMTTFRETMTKLSEEIRKYELPFFPKFGITFYMPRANSKVTIQTLIGQASFAKSTIKDNMMTQYSIYNSRLLEQINKERAIELGMEAAIENKEFFVMYQPKIALSSDKVVGAEALVRWYNKDMGLLTPDKFIPLFERNGFITKLDFYVYEQVFQFLERQINEGNQVLPISLNMSRNHSKPDKFMHDFLTLYRKYKVPSHLIQIEILERSVMDSNTLQEVTDMLHKEGFSVAMDDFGSGESSLNMLTNVPVDVLKFDRNFLLSSTTEEGSIDKKSARFIEILIELSKHLEKETVFEGVETQAQRDFLRSIHCDQAQGYFYSKPLSEQDFVEFIKLHS